MNEKVENPYNAPLPNLIDLKSGNPILKFTRFSAWLVFLLCSVTFGFYPVYWLYSRTVVVNSVHKRKISMNWTYALVSTFITHFALQLVISENDGFLNIILILLSLASVIIYFGLLFTLKSRLEDVISNSGGKRSHLNGIATLLFNVIYLQFKINQCIEEQKISEVLAYRVSNPDEPP